MTASTEAADTVTLNKKTIDFVVEYIREEMETLFALANAVVWQIGQPDPKQPKDTDNITAYRLAELLEERVGSAKFLDSVSDILMKRI